MSDNLEELARTAKEIIEKNGQEAYDMAKAEIINSKYDGGQVSEALKYFTKANFTNALPVFPALLTLSCKAVGKSSKKTVSVGASLALIAWAADIHDDIIDQSLTKYSQQTVFGKFGGSIALLAGDALLIQGNNLLHKESAGLTENQKNTIVNSVSEALFEISKAEAKEVTLRSKADVTPEDVFALLELKAVVPALHCKIGAVLGQANSEEVAVLEKYGRIYGMVALLFEEFMDFLEYDELQNRIKNELLPLPILCAYQNLEAKDKIVSLIANFKQESHKELIRIVNETQQAKELENILLDYAKKGTKESRFITGSHATEELALLLSVISGCVTG
jgi:geranylgeranyl pyrophosphate synthase